MKMPRSRIIDVGVVLIVAVALLWLGAEFTKRIEWMLPYLLGIGIVLLVGGVVAALWKGRKA